MRPIFYDTETTGTRPDKDRIIEIAAFDPIQNRTFEALINPGSPIPQEATAIHGISDAMVADAPTFAKVGADFIAFCEGEVVLIAHNNDAFDRLFLAHECKRHSLELPPWPMLDTLKWSRKYRYDLPRHSLQFLRQTYGIAENEAHRALNDVHILHQVFTAMTDDLPITKIMELLEGTSTASLDYMPFGKHQGKPLKEVPANYVSWLSTQGALDKPENAGLKMAFEKLGLLK